MKILSTLTFPGKGPALLEKGKIILEKGRVMMALRLLVTLSITNSSGTSRALTDAERQTFLDGYSFTLSYGRNGRRKPLNKVTGTRVQKLARFLIGSDWEGYANAVTGLARTLTTGATTQVQFYITVATGRAWMLGALKKLWGVGRTQAKGMQLEVVRKSDDLPTGFAISGNVTMDVIPEDHSRKGPEVWTYLPEWHEVDETDKRAYLPPGGVMLAVERSTPLATSQLSDVRAAVDGEELYSSMSVQTAYAPTLDIVGRPAEADISDRETVLYQVTEDMELRDWLSGVFSFEQITKTLGTLKLGGLILPIPEDTEVNEDVQDAAGKNGRNKTLKAINAAAVYNLYAGELPHSLYPYMPMVLVDEDDKEFKRFPGKVSAAGGPTEVFVPLSIRDSARMMIASFEANGESALAEDTKRQAALAVPAAVQDTRGLSRAGSPALGAVRGVLE